MKLLKNSGSWNILGEYLNKKFISPLPPYLLLRIHGLAIHSILNNTIDLSKSKLAIRVYSISPNIKYPTMAIISKFDEYAMTLTNYEDYI